MGAKPATGKGVEIKLAHSPDSDDAFMFYALATHKVRTPGLSFTHVLKDIESLNQAAESETFDVTAVSFYGYAFIADRYALLDCGASFGEGYGPIMISARPMKKEELAGCRVAVPGTRTTSFLALKLFEPNVETLTLPFDTILDAVRNREVEAGLLIHEGQLLYSQAGLQKVVDLGHWWREETGLPLPLGANAIRRSLGREIARKVAGGIRESVAYALDHREEALNYAMQFARDLEPDLADKFVGMYVNALTLSYGKAGKKAVRELFARGEAAGLVPKGVKLDFIGAEEE